MDVIYEYEHAALSSNKIFNAALRRKSLPTPGLEYGYENQAHGLMKKSFMKEKAARICKI